MKNLFEGIRSWPIEAMWPDLIELLYPCRIHFVKSISKRKEKDILLLKARLDEYNDEWRTADTSDTASNNFPSLIRTSAQGKSKKYTPRKYKKNTDNANNSKNDGATTNGSAKEKEPKPRKRQKSVMRMHLLWRGCISMAWIFNLLSDKRTEHKTGIEST